ncbi:hypothetical protein HDU76_009931 [Blyttiomyces sp. JEL0837]|nr:hypothetical protein HDU76_009931 [Blyttiomyces sp. JEL0837]
MQDTPPSQHLSPLVKSNSTPSMNPKTARLRTKSFGAPSYTNQTSLNHQTHLDIGHFKLNLELSKPDPSFIADIERLNQQILLTIEEGMMAVKNVVHADEECEHEILTDGSVWKQEYEKRLQMQMDKLERIINEERTEAQGEVQSMRKDAVDEIEKIRRETSLEIVRLNQRIQELEHSLHQLQLDSIETITELQTICKSYEQRSAFIETRRIASDEAAQIRIQELEEENRKLLDWKTAAEFWWRDLCSGGGYYEDAGFDKRGFQKVVSGDGLDEVVRRAEEKRVRKMKKAGQCRGFFERDSWRGREPEV